MPTNEQRRDAAKRKLERQLENRAARARRRKQATIAAAVIGLVVVIGGVAVAIGVTRSDDDTAVEASDSPTSENATPEGMLPAGRSEPLPETVSCSYPAGGAAAKPANAPQTENVPTTDDNVSVSMDTSQGPIGLSLDATKAPCTVNSFASLAGQNYYDATPCHRLTTADSLKVLQCGDPTGAGTGGPGYQYANEFPTDQYADDPAALQSPVLYPRGTIAMANAGADTNGSQFFLVFGDSQLPPNYTVFGTIDETGLATLDKIAAAGVEGGAQDGAPALATTLNTVQLDLA
ncbi:peptidylprolyl isomerase [Rhodococcus sp. BP-349]|uniref:peptidylprolyl isomerase n=1 Tax=unclassified Rhodococcus (in: high G+C Gram-positive bacteria) TaxID=192944 RepID=UPI001C9B1A06|nr:MULTISPECIES: peptidylprolyl isomerase [unclassified Rhodococcus (in: high G+C Gram-positive bacteria)]MBY6541114.1 peptidylprolyl isomerase [Rhodococcus sp. BP-363]MBY6544860.1 peptidylprolyl isomerase [Rhodococcus sp. BP-369]MBY6564090.1 peptidylprolyl isomerase [Rhodococcus sp. BP-370]MBY6578973.1 peptidylprolyl isomerase [Rhodococcus sp. BP-364]MBY6588274.1 peptidylprolyl isomerase [Rhodococcus sp. BP-358]